MGYPLARLNLVSVLAQLYGNFTFELAPEVRYKLCSSLRTALLKHVAPGSQSRALCLAFAAHSYQISTQASFEMSGLLLSPG